MLSKNKHDVEIKILVIHLSLNVLKLFNFRFLQVLEQITIGIILGVILVKIFFPLQLKVMPQITFQYQIDILHLHPNIK